MIFKHRSSAITCLGSRDLMRSTLSVVKGFRISALDVGDFISYRVDATLSSFWPLYCISVDTSRPVVGQSASVCYLPFSFVNIPLLALKRLLLLDICRC